MLRERIQEKQADTKEQITTQIQNGVSKYFKIILVILAILCILVGVHIYRTRGK